MMSRFQKLTVAAILLYLIWEAVVFFWAKQEGGPIIRADLFFIYPVLLLLIIVSLVQWWRRKA